MNKSHSTGRDSVGKRTEVSEHEGEHKYGNVTFADETNKKYPIDTPEHIRAAWGYINHKDNAAKYDSTDVKKIKERIKHAADKHSVEISSD